MCIWTDMYCVTTCVVLCNIWRVYTQCVLRTEKNNYLCKLSIRMANAAAATAASAVAISLSIINSCCGYSYARVNQ